MNLRIIAIGKIREKFIQDGIAEYSKRLAAYGRLEIVELREESFRELLSAKERLQIVTKEGERILAQLEPFFVFVLDPGAVPCLGAFAEPMSMAVQGISLWSFRSAFWA